MAAPRPAESELLAALTTYVGTELLDPRDSEGLTATTPLLEWGILNSIKWAKLVAHIREEYGVRIPHAELVSENFRDLESIAKLVAALDGDS